MAFEFTLNYNWKLPVPGTEVDLWGGELNETVGRIGTATADNIDADLFTVQGLANTAQATANLALPKAGGTMTGPIVLAADASASLNPTTLQQVNVSLALKANLASPILTGDPQAPTPATVDNDTSIATTAFTQAAIVAGIASKANLASPVFTGDPTAPTPAFGDNDTSIATTAFVQLAVATVTENAQVGTAYTLVLADAGKMVTMSNAASIILTVPTNASVAFQIGTRIDLTQLGAGQVSVSPTGITLLSASTKRKLTGQYSGATLWKQGTNTWFLYGDIAA